MQADTRHHAMQSAAVCRPPHIRDSWHMHASPTLIIIIIIIRKFITRTCSQALIMSRTREEGTFLNSAVVLIIVMIRMWADAHRDNRPAEYRWRLLFNVAKFG